MRAHVEVDKLVNRKCLDVGLALKKEFGPQGRGICDIQIAGCDLLPRYFAKVKG